MLVAAACAVAISSADATPVGDALQRPALLVRQAERSVLLALAHAGQGIVAVGERGVIVRSEDQGKTWRQMPCPVSVSLTMVRFADAEHGVAVGHGGTVLTTQDGGRNWQVRLNGTQLSAIALRDAVNDAQRTEAARLAADGPDKPFLDVLLWDARHLLAVGAYGLAFYSPDGGATWQSWMGRLPNPRGMHWYVARRQDQSVLLAGEQGLLAQSDDGGKTFHSMPSPYRGSWFSAELQPGGRLTLVGLRGNVWQSSDAGRRWVAIPTPNAASILASAQTPAGDIVLATQAGQMLRLQGQRVTPVNTTPLPTPAGILPLTNDQWLAVGVAGVVPVPAFAQVQGAQP
ncbi:hypothetical protein KIK84_05355 [Curvibacter sp. CHRR-16]|uniref:WD40/YVTN/BNR-like repeat-containing protein n=1 Tax=Curvibacter sp. CHRR-16 TaxID=2835872 RepID=UPI001BDA3940|nr:YCF48-related protein [Curvibacter sp. CHRR-16]MBT0569743.1 hypothetical protein [Curvibacter sp. CHRR-16]